MASRPIICRSRRLRQIIDLRYTDKTWYFAITEFSNCFNNCFDYPYSPEKRSANFQTRAWLQLRMSRIFNKFSKVLRMSRPSIVVSYLQVTWWALGLWKGRDDASNENNIIAHWGFKFHPFDHSGNVKDPSLTVKKDHHLLVDRKTWFTIYRIDLETSL